MPEREKQLPLAQRVANHKKALAIRENEKRARDTRTTQELVLIDQHELHRAKEELRPQIDMIDETIQDPKLLQLLREVWRGYAPFEDVKEKPSPKRILSQRNAVDGEKVTQRVPFEVRTVNPDVVKKGNEYVLRPGVISVTELFDIYVDSDHALIRMPNYALEGTIKIDELKEKLILAIAHSQLNKTPNIILLAEILGLKPVHNEASSADEQPTS